MAAVEEHHCGGWVYRLHGPDGPLLLDAAAVVGGRWEPALDGRRAIPAAQGSPIGWAEHRCVPEGQETLL